MYIATYGSLRQGIKGNGLNLRERLVGQYGPEAMRYVTSDRVKGFKLYDLGNYPTAVYDPNSNNELDIDIYLCDQNVIDRIDNIETSAGYYAKVIRPRLLDSPAIIYLWQDHEVKGTKIGQVLSGDWVGYVNTRGKVRA